MKIATSRLASACAVGAILAGCAGSPGSLVPLAPQASAAAHGPRTATSLMVSLKVPSGAPPASVLLAVNASIHGKRLAGVTLNPVPGASVCGKASGGWFECEESLAIKPGTYSLQVTTFSGKNGSGKFVTPLPAYPFVAVTGVNNLSFSLGGAPAAVGIALMGTSLFATGTQSTGFHLAGVGKLAQQIAVVDVKDAQGNVLLGTAVPSPTFATTATSHLAITAIAGTQGRFYTLTPLAQTSAAVVATAKAGTLSVKAGFALQPVFYSINCSNTTVTEFVPWSNNPIATITSYDGIFSNSAMAVDASGNLYVANYGAASPSSPGVMVFAPGSTKAFRTISNLNYPEFLAVDASGDVYVNENNADVEEFTPGGGSTPSRVLSTSTSPTGISSPYGLAIDANQNLIVANDGLGVSIYAPGQSTTPAAVISAGTNGARWPAFDTSGNLYVVNNGGSNVTEYATPLSASSPVAHTFGSSASINGPGSIAVDGQGNVYVVNTGNETVSEFSPSGSLVRTIDGLSLWGTNLVATDAIGKAYFPNDDYNTVAVFAPGSATSPAATYASPGGPMDVAVWP